MKSKKYSYTLSLTREVTEEKQEAINDGVMISCIITGGLAGLYFAYDLAVNELILNLSFWDALWQIPLYSVSLIFAGVTCGGFGSFLVIKVIHGLFLVEPVWFFFRNRYEFKGNDRIFNRLLYWPFLRLIPLIIIPLAASTNSPFTVTGTNALAFFMVGKIIIDQIMHVQQLKAFHSSIPS